MNEGIQALSSSEEEKKGVAASLLAPLLSEVVKEEEERWRRKVICKEELEPLMEEDVVVEQAATVAEQLESNRDFGDDPSQEDLCSVVQSGESAEEEEEEQDTLELEMVLERKKVSEFPLGCRVSFLMELKWIFQLGNKKRIYYRERAESDISCLPACVVRWKGPIQDPFLTLIVPSFRISCPRMVNSEDTERKKETKP